MTDQCPECGSAMRLEESAGPVFPRLHELGDPKCKGTSKVSPDVQRQLILSHHQPDSFTGSPSVHR